MRYDGPVSAVVGVPVEDLVWMAGFFDGEGCLGCYRVKDYSANDPEKAPRIWAVIVALVNTELGLLEVFRKYFGGSIFKRKSKRANVSDAYMLSLRGNRQVLSFLLTILPYLKSEKKRAKALEILRLRSYLLMEVDRKKYGIPFNPKPESSRTRYWDEYHVKRRLRYREKRLNEIVYGGEEWKSEG